MAVVAAVADVEALLAPIAGDNPAGTNLQYAGLHDEIREARRSEEIPADWKQEPKRANWSGVVELATIALATKTKDLQVCSWLAEALVKIHGFAGLRDGLRLMRGLHERFWEHVYPEIDEEDLEARANCLSWMDRQLAFAAKELPITQDVGGESYSFFQWEKDLAARKSEITGDQWGKLLKSTRRVFCEKMYVVIEDCWQEFQALDKVMDEKFSRKTPGLGELKKSLEGIRALIERFIRDKRIAEPDPVEPPPTIKEKPMTQRKPVEPRSVSTGTTDSIASREEALKRLGEVAEFFLMSEPHSPISYLVQRAIKWGQMPLEDWLRDVVKDAGVLDHLRETLGIKTSSGSNASTE